MMLLTVGCSHRTAPVEVREKLAFDHNNLVRVFDDLPARYGCELVVLSTCNRVELYLGRPEGELDIGLEQIAGELARFHNVSAAALLPHLYERRQVDAVRHVFRVVASLDSMLVGEGQIAGQVKRAYELAHQYGVVGPLLHALFQHSHQVAKRVRTETGIARGHVSVSSAAVDYVRQVFDRFDDKSVLVIGAGKISELALRHLRNLKPQRIWIANRSTDRAVTMALNCQGVAVPWEQLDDILARADIVLSATGAPEPIVTWERYQKILARRSGGPCVILDIAVPRDFDPRIHDGDGTCLFNIDDLKRIREQTIRDRLRHVAAAEGIIEAEVDCFMREWGRRRHGPVIARLTRDFETKRLAIVQQLLARLNGRLTDEDRGQIEGAFRLLQNQFLHGPLSALAEEPHEPGRHTLLEALRKLFRLHD
jgi:glutamyl-tRNA reductase